MKLEKDAAYQPNPLLATRSSDYRSRHKKGDAGCGSSSFDWAVNLETLTVAYEERIPGDHSRIH